MNTNLNTLEFNGTELQVLQHEGQLWLTAEQVGRCLGYAEDSVRISVVNLYNRSADEFSEYDTCVIKLISQGQGRDTRIFSATGCNLLGFFANTECAKDFRVWAKKMLAGQAVVMQPAPGTPLSLDTAQLARLFDSLEKMVSLMPRVLGVMEQMLSAMPKMLEATHPAKRSAGRKKMYAEDVARIKDLSASGYLLDDLVAETGFSQSQCYAVTAGRYKVLESGRVSIDLRSDVAKAADAAAKAQREGATPATAELWAVK